MNTYNIKIENTNIGDITVVLPLSTSGSIGEDLFNYSNSSITGVVLDANNNIRYYVRWSAWSYPQYRTYSDNSYNNPYADLTFTNEVTGTYEFYNVEKSLFDTNFPFIAVVLIVILIGSFFCVPIIKGG